MAIKEKRAAATLHPNKNFEDIKNTINYYCDGTRTHNGEPPVNTVELSDVYCAKSCLSQLTPILISERVCQFPHTYLQIIKFTFAMEEVRHLLNRQLLS